MNALLFVFLGYLLGSVPFAVVFSKVFGLADPRTFGSGNPGATNVLRTGNKAAALLTVLGDAAKGWLAMALARWLGAAEDAAALAGLAAFLGHIFPLFLGFRGGKGVATALGVLLGFSGLLGLSAAATWALVAFAFRYSSLAALAAAVEAPVAAWFLLGRSEAVAPLAVMSALLIWRHRGNIQRLLAGNENRIGAKKT